MSLDRAELPDGSSTGLPHGPVPCFDLIPLVGQAFRLPCEDPWLRQEGTRAHAYLDAARSAWEEHPDLMDYLDLSSPVGPLKRAERDLYLHHWKTYLKAEKVLDVGCGIGRMTLPLLDRGATVVAVDGDLQSLQRLVWHAAGRDGRLQVHWSSLNKLPDQDDFDLIIAAEVLCYSPDAQSVLSELTRRLRPGGHLLLSWEAPYGWAAAEDAPPDSLDQALSTEGIIDLPEDRWVHTVSEPTLRDMLERAGLEVVHVEPTHYAVDGPLERCLPDSLSLEQLLEVESRCKAHPVWAPLHRLWTATARRPPGLCGQP